MPASIGPDKQSPLGSSTARTLIYLPPEGVFATSYVMAALAGHRARAPHRPDVWRRSRLFICANIQLSTTET